MGILRQHASRHLAYNQHTESLKTSVKLQIPTDWQSVHLSPLDVMSRKRDWNGSVPSGTSIDPLIVWDPAWVVNFPE